MRSIRVFFDVDDDTTGAGGGVLQIIARIDEISLRFREEQRVSVSVTMNTVVDLRCAGVQCVIRS